MGSTIGGSLPYSRLMESEADRLAVIYMKRAGYDPQAAIAIFTMLDAMTPDNEFFGDMLSTHPADKKRLENIKGIVESEK